MSLRCIANITFSRPMDDAALVKSPQLLRRYNAKKLMAEFSGEGWRKLRHRHGQQNVELQRQTGEVCALKVT